MSVITPALLEQVRERARIVDLFSPAELRKAGSEYIASCPWHEDRRPSLTVSPKRNRVHCFVCGKGTDAIGWLQQSSINPLEHPVGVEVATGTGDWRTLRSPEPLLCRSAVHQ